MKIFDKVNSMKMENKLLLLAVACGLLAAATGYLFITVKESNLVEEMKPVKVLVAAKYITTHAQLKEDMVQEAEMPAKFVTSAHVMDFKRLKGKMALVPFLEGEPLLLNKVSAKADELSAAVPTGLRAISVGVDEESSCGFMIKPGDYVDVLLTFETTEAKKVYTVTATILQASQVIATGTDFEQDAPEKKYNSLTLAVSPDESEILTFAREKGRITFSLRGAGDNTREKIKLASFNELVKQIKSNERAGEDIKTGITGGGDENMEQNIGNGTAIKKREE